MTFQPIIPSGGILGWNFLSRTRESQEAAFENSSEIVRNVDYFKENISKVSSAEELINDRRLLQVALGAFGLDDDINNKFFLQKVLDDGTVDSDALANRLADKRYLEFSKAFGFGDFSTPRTVLSDFGEEITSAYKSSQFEIAVGNQDSNMRLALGLDDALTTIVNSSTTDNGRWFSVMGQPAVRAVFEVALGLPSSVGALDLDLQLTIFRERLESRFGDGEISQFSNSESIEEMRKIFLTQSDLNNSTSNISNYSSAISILNMGSNFSENILNILTSRKF
jgi:hypothetical protein